MRALDRVEVVRRYLLEAQRGIQATGRLHLVERVEQHHREAGAARLVEQGLRQHAAQAEATDIAGLRHEIDAIHMSGVLVQSVLWNVGSARLLGAFVDMGVLREPVYAHIALANTFLAAHPPSVRGLETLVEFLPRGVDIHWTFSAVGANALGLVHAAVGVGGHVSIGLGDYPYNELGTPTNAQLVAEVVRMVRAVGREPATPDEVRQVFGLGA